MIFFLLTLKSIFIHRCRYDSFTTTINSSQDCNEFSTNFLQITDPFRFSDFLAIKKYWGLFIGHWHNDITDLRKLKIKNTRAVFVQTVLFIDLLAPWMLNLYLRWGWFSFLLKFMKYSKHVYSFPSVLQWIKRKNNYSEIIILQPSFLWFRINYSNTHHYFLLCDQIIYLIQYTIHCIVVNNVSKKIAKPVFLCIHCSWNNHQIGIVPWVVLFSV